MTGSDRQRAQFRRTRQFGETEEHHHDRIRSELEEASGLIVKISREPVAPLPYYPTRNGYRIAGYTPRGLELSEHTISVAKPRILQAVNAFMQRQKRRSAGVKP